MTKKFYQDLFNKHRKRDQNPNLEKVFALSDRLLRMLFPERCSKEYILERELELEFEELKIEFIHLISKVKPFLTIQCDDIAEQFFEKIPYMYNEMRKDATAITNNDPAARDELEVIKTYPGFYGIAIHRMAHELYKLNVPYIPRLLSEMIHSRTGIDIHPGASIGSSFCIDHGTGIVIGETCVIGNNVKVYQNVTLGALSVDKSLSNQKRHPTIMDNVIIYSGATILGGESVIGENTIIGGNVWLTHGVPANVKVYNRSEVIIKE
ncbi:MAG: serine acetyltransferase [Ichthyobacteriaceae bacterium]|nr:serine acetyltransferase [Ichthyobacteriaceae bacterium]